LIRSMTGFGKASGDYDGSIVSIELNTVNHRYLDASMRLPGEWSATEPSLREILKDYLTRGKLNISVNRKRLNGSTQKLVLDKEVAQAYIDASRELMELSGTDEAVTLTTLAQFPGVFQQHEDEEDLEQAQAMLSALLKDALVSLNTMRDVEGQKLNVELTLRIKLIRDTVEEVEQRLPELSELYKSRLQERILELVEDNTIAEERIAMEVALLSDKGDVTEEIVRLKSHLDHAEELMNAEEACGRQLNFLTQEVQREINTLGSKVRDTDVVRHVLTMKSELEKFREQIQNVE
jgi:uncharacterized protein (TIGR00255 family)